MSTVFHDQAKTIIYFRTVTTPYISINVLLTISYPMRIYIGTLDAICERKKT